MKPGQIITYHQVIKKAPRRWSNPTTKRSYGIRGHVHYRHSIFAVSGGAQYSTWGAENWVILKLHSCQTWKMTKPEAIRASTEIQCSRDEAEMMILALTAGISEFDRQVAEVAKEKADDAAIVESVVNEAIAALA